MDFSITIGDRLAPVGGHLVDGEVHLVDCFNNRWTCAVPWLGKADDLLAASMGATELSRGGPLWWTDGRALHVDDVAGEEARRIARIELGRPLMVYSPPGYVAVLSERPDGPWLTAPPMVVLYCRLLSWFFARGLPEGAAYTSRGAEQLLYISLEAADEDNMVQLDMPAYAPFVAAYGLPADGVVGLGRLVDLLVPEAGHQAGGELVVNVPADDLGVCIPALLNDDFDNTDLAYFKNGRLCTDVDGEPREAALAITDDGVTYLRTDAGWTVFTRMFDQGAPIVDHCPPAKFAATPRLSTHMNRLVNGLATVDGALAQVNGPLAEGGVLPVDRDALGGVTDHLYAAGDGVFIDLVNGRFSWGRASQAKGAFFAVAADAPDGLLHLSASISDYFDGAGRPAVLVQLVSSRAGGWRLLSRLMMSSGGGGGLPALPPARGMQGVVAGEAAAATAALLMNNGGVAVFRDGACAVVDPPTDRAAGVRLLVIGSQVCMLTWPQEGAGTLWRLAADDHWVRAATLSGFACAGAEPCAAVAGHLVVYVSGGSARAVDARTWTAADVDEDVDVGSLRTCAGYAFSVDGGRVQLLGGRLEPLLRADVDDPVRRLGCRDGAWYAVVEDAQGFMRLRPLAWRLVDQGGVDHAAVR